MSEKVALAPLGGVEGRPRWSHEDHRLFLHDNREPFAFLEDGEFDSIVCDPPYELVGKSGKGGFMGKAWDATGIAYDMSMWRECLRVLKPGGHLLAFGGSRTWHRMVCAIEDAGFEIRDEIMWLYGSGMPKNGVTDGRSSHLKPAHEPICVARKPLQGTVASNVLRYGTGALNVDACRVPTGSERLAGSTVRDDIRGGNYAGGHTPNPGDIAPYAQHEGGRFPANVILDPEAAAALDLQSGVSSSRSSFGRQTAKRGTLAYGDFAGTQTEAGHNDTGGASRFFYCSKASRADREEGNDHATVKPTALCRYLLRLVTPPGGRSLDPFCGSGSFGKAAVQEGFGWCGIDRDAHHLDIAQSRLENALRHHTRDLFAGEAA